MGDSVQRIFKRSRRGVAFARGFHPQAGETAPGMSGGGNFGL
jgi:hypothetical protein